MAKGKRKTIILNEDNPKERLILELLEKQYNASEFIKDLLFNYIQNNNNLHDNNTMVIPLPHNDNSMVNVLPYDDNCITTSLPHDDNAHNSNFIIDLNNVSDADVEVNTSAQEDPTQNALEFLKGF